MAVATETTDNAEVGQTLAIRQRLAQRGCDLVIGIVGSVLTAPVVLVLLIGSALVFRVNPLFVQPRVGRGGRVIPVPKVRTLPVSTPYDSDKYALRTVEVPAWGRVLRRLHLDELPQLWSVVLGHMSLVGPRPEMPRLVERFPPSFAAARHSMRPGITGLWQISEAASGLISEAPKWDMTYVANAGFRLDAWIVWRTIRQYLPGGTPISLDDLPSWLQSTGEPADVYPHAS